MDKSLKSIAIKALCALKRQSEHMANTIHWKLYQQGGGVECLTDEELYYILGFPPGYTPTMNEVLDYMKKNLSEELIASGDLPIITGMVIS